MTDFTIRIDPRPSSEAFAAFCQEAWGSPPTGDPTAIWSRSLAHLGAYAGDRLAGYLNIAWDGGVHAFILDTAVHPDYRHQGLGSRLVKQAAVVARERGAKWLHVDYEPQFDGFYTACGFRPTKAGLIRLSA